MGVIRAVYEMTVEPVLTGIVRRVNLAVRSSLTDVTLKCRLSERELYTNPSVVLVHHYSDLMLCLL